MRVLGIDPGLTRCGVGVVDGSPGRPLTLVHVEVIRTPADADSRTACSRSSGPSSSCSTRAARRRRRRAGLQPAQRPHRHGHRPGRSGRDRLRRRVAASRSCCTPRARSRPRSPGSGRADKDQVGDDGGPPAAASTEAPKPADAADALALAICHLWRGDSSARLAAAAAAAPRSRVPRSAAAARSPRTSRRRRRCAMIAYVRGSVASVGRRLGRRRGRRRRSRAAVRPAARWPGCASGIRRPCAASLVVREDSLTLYGFADEDERSVFEILQTVTGVGPQLAQAVLAALSPDDAAPCGGDGGPDGVDRRSPASAARAPSGSFSSSRTGSGLRPVGSSTSASSPTSGTDLARARSARRSSASAGRRARPTPPSRSSPRTWSPTPTSRPCSALALRSLDRA